MKNFSNLKGKRILIIEDDPEVSPRLIKLLKSKLNVVPVWAGSKEESLNILKNNEKFDFAILDIMMPVTKKQRIKNDELYRRWSLLITEMRKIEDEKNQGTKNYAELRTEQNVIEQEIKNNIKIGCGFDILKEWVEKYPESFKKTLFLILTARDDSGIKKEIRSFFCKYNSSYELVLKPVGSDEIFSTLEKLQEQSIIKDKMNVEIETYISQTPDSLTLEFEFPDWISDRQKKDEIIAFYKALNAYHISCGGYGLKIDDWKKTVYEHKFEEV